MAIGETLLGIQIFPNPSSGMFNIEVITEEDLIKVFSTFGVEDGGKILTQSPATERWRGFCFRNRLPD